MTNFISHCFQELSSAGTSTKKIFVNFASLSIDLLTHGVTGNTSDFGSAESWFEPRWVNKKSERGSESPPSLKLRRTERAHSHFFVSLFFKSRL
jgi:hypothetical protein